MLRQAAGHTSARPLTTPATPPVGVEDSTVVDDLCVLLNKGTSGADFVQAASGLIQAAGRPLVDTEAYEISAEEEEGNYGLTIGLVSIGDTTVRVFQSLIAPHGVVVAIDPTRDHAAALATEIGDHRIYGTT